MCNERRERQLTYADAPGVVEMAEREELKQQLAEANAAREQAEQEAANLYKQRIDAKLRIEQLMAEAGMLRGLVSSAIGYISMEHEWSTDQADVWLSIATTALASGARTDTVGA